MNKWKSIETAPKDGSHVLLFRPEIQFIGYYGGGNSGWRINAPDLPAMWPLPTHWMSLPDNPYNEALKMNKFDQLVEDLCTGKLSHTQIKVAYKCYIQRRSDIPDEIKDLLCGGIVLGGQTPGLINRVFNLLSEIIGRTELAFRRGTTRPSDEQMKQTSAVGRP